jgi:hypothetical protein
MLTTDEMLESIVTLMFFGGMWHARATGSAKFATGSTPREAMERALLEGLF